MHRIYKSVLTDDYVIRTTFFNGEVKEINLTTALNDEYTAERLSEYLHLYGNLVINNGRTAICIGDKMKIDSESLYYSGRLVDVEYIEDINIRTATRLQCVREAKGMTQGDVEHITGIHQAEISKIERGVGNPSIGTLSRLATGLGYRINIDFEKRSVKNEPGNIAVAPYLKSGKCQGEYVMDDLLSLPDEVKVELIDGYIYDQAMPSILHQRISMNISNKFYDYIKKNNGECEVLATVAITFAENDKNYISPDLVVVCDKEKIKEDRILGAPDFVLEIVSKSNSRIDYGIKQSLYAENGVREYWILDPIKECLVVYQYEKDYIPRVHRIDETVEVGIYGGELKINIWEIMV